MLSRVPKIFFMHWPRKPVNEVVPEVGLFGKLLALLLDFHESFSALESQRLLSIGHDIKYHCFSGNCACQFPSAQQFSNNGHSDSFPQAFPFTFIGSISCRLFNSCDPFIVVPTRRIAFLLIQICNILWGLYLVNELATMAVVF